MSLNSQYHRIISAVTLAVMLWNIFGWLGTGLVINQMHSHDEGDYCEVSFCSCEVKEGQAYCSCHHPELHHNEEDDAEEMSEHHSDSSQGNEFCFYSSPHPVDSNPGEALLAFAKFNALLESQVSILFSVKSESYSEIQTHFIPSGFYGELLRPPRS